MKKIISLFTALLFFFSSFAQKGSYGKETFDSLTLIVPTYNSVSVTILEKSNGFAGISYIHIIGDTAISDTVRWGIQNFDWHDNSTTRACSVYPLKCETKYTIELVTKCKNQSIKTSSRTFVTSKCMDPIKISFKKKRSWLHRLFFGTGEKEKPKYSANKNPAQECTGFSF